MTFMIQVARLSALYKSYHEEHILEISRIFIDLKDFYILKIF